MTSLCGRVARGGFIVRLPMLSAEGRRAIAATTVAALRSGVAALAWLACARSGAAAELVRHELRVPGAVQRVLAEDLDQDGRMELLVFSVTGSRDPERRVNVFAFAGDVLGSGPRTSWLLDSEAGLFDLGRDPGEGASLWYCTASAVRRYRLRDALARAPSAEPWLEAPSLLGGRSDEWVLFYDFVRDWRGDGAETPAVFQPGRVVLPRRDPSAAADVLDLTTEIELSELPVSRALLSRWPLFVTHRVPDLTRVDADGDGRADLVATLGDRVAMHSGTADGSFARRAQRVDRLPSAARPGDETRRQAIQLADLTGDSRVDAVLTTSTGGISNLRQVTDIFPGTGAGFASTPSASLPTQGAASLTVLADLDGDGRPELTTASITIGVGALLRFLLTRRMSVEYATYGIDQKGQLGPQPLVRWAQPVRVDLGGPSDPSIVTLAGDFDGDGVRDVVSAADDDAVEIRRLVRAPGGLAMGDVIARAEAPGRGQALATDLDGDGRSDLVVYAPRGPEGIVTVFLSR